MCPIKIFISHSKEEEPLAAAFVNCLLSSISVGEDDVLCTSVAGHKLPTGCNFPEAIRNNICKCGVVIGLLTQKSAHSSWVLFELGASWGARKDIKILADDDVDFTMLPSPLSAQHIAIIQNRDDVAQLMGEIASLVEATPRKLPIIVNAIERFVTFAIKDRSERFWKQFEGVKPTIGKIKF